MLPVLDARLSAAAELVRPGLPAADIGCDHGKLAAVLAGSGRCPRVIGADLRPGPLAKARRTLEAAGCQDKVELRLGDGLSVLREGEAATIVLAGVSAQTTWEILEKAPWVFQPGGPRLVLVPATRHGGVCPGGGPAGPGSRPVVCGDGGGAYRPELSADFGAVLVWRDRLLAGGGCLCSLAAGKAAQTAAGCAGRHPAGR